MSAPLPPAPPKTPPRKEQTNAPLSTPLSAGMSSVAEYGNNWGRKEVVKWLIADVAQTQDAQVLEMLHAFTKRIMPSDSKEKPADVFECIRQQVERVRLIAMAEAAEVAEAAKAAKAAAKAKKRARTKAKPKATSSPSTSKPPMRGHANRRKKAGTSGDATQAAKEPTTAEKGVTMSQAYEEFLTATLESATYCPFINMTNSALDLLKNEHVDGTIARNTEYDILLQHNDPNLLRHKINGNEHNRKPDNIFVTLETARKLHSNEKASWSDITATWAMASPTKNGKGRASLDWGDALCSVEHKRTPCVITQSNQQKLDESNMLPLLGDLVRHRQMKSSGKRPIEELSEVNETTSGSKRAKTSQGVRVTATGPSHADSEDSRACIPGPAPEADLLNSVAVQSAEYGLGRLCCSYDMSHAFTLIVVDGVLHISWYDHEGIITTNGLNLAMHFDYYLALLFILQRFNRSAWGRLADENLRSNRNGTKDETRISVEGQEFTFNMNVNENVLRKPFAIGGRATSLYRAQKEGDQAPQCVIKFNWKEATRETEQFILREIHRRLKEQKLVNSETEKVFDESDDLLSYLPDVVAGVETEISTKMIRDDLKIPSHPRALVVIVFMMLDGTIRELQGEEYWQVFWDCLRCHKRLFKLKIYHCDISDGNLMFIRKNGHTFGVLNDFDLAVIADMPSENQRRTGTRPFMALELLQPGQVKRHYRHDVESFFWVVVYNSTSKKLVNGWGLLTNRELIGEKSTYLLFGTDRFPMKESHQPIISWVDGFRRLLASSRLETQENPKDWGIDELYSTLCGLRDDQGHGLVAHIETRMEKYRTPTDS